MCVPFDLSTQLKGSRWCQGSRGTRPGEAGIEEPWTPNPRLTELGIFEVADTVEQRGDVATAVEQTWNKLDGQGQIMALS